MNRAPGGWPMGRDDCPIPHGTFVLLRDAIARRTGVFFDDAKCSVLADKLSELVSANGFSSFLDYYYLLQYDAAADLHWGALMDRLAVPETYFWRQPEQFRAVADFVAPAHFASFPGRPLRIWSAACCSGEEPISLAIALAEVGLMDPERIEIRATDASEALLDRARAGIYGQRSFRQMPVHLKARYFEQIGDDRWRVAPSVHRPIRWSRANLASPPDVARYAACDVIFCRNVFIYFNDDSIRETARLFSEYLSPDGFLFVGASESLTRFGLELELSEVAGAFVYVKLGRRQIVERAAAHKASKPPMSAIQRAAS